MKKKKKGANLEHPEEGVLVAVRLWNEAVLQGLWHLWGRENFDDQLQSNCVDLLVCVSEQVKDHLTAAQAEEGIKNVRLALGSGHRAVQLGGKL